MGPAGKLNGISKSVNSLFHIYIKQYARSDGHFSGSYPEVNKISFISVYYHACFLGQHFNLLLLVS